MKLLTCATSRSRQLLLLTLIFSIPIRSDADGNETTLGGSLALGSDYTFRGVSQTMGNYSVQASVDIDFASGLYANAWGSNVDFVPDGEPDDGARYEIDLAIGFVADIGNNWNVDLAFVRYQYPGTIDDANYDFNEVSATLWFSEQYSTMIAFSDNVDNTGADSLLYELGANFDLPAETSLQLNYGHYNLSNAYGSAYSYTSATLARSVGNATIMFTYVDTHDSADLIFDERAIEPRFVLSLQIDW